MHSGRADRRGESHPTIRDLGRQLRVNVESADDLAERETALAIPDLADVGAHGPNAMILRRTVRAIARDDPTLATAYKFLTSTVWPRSVRGDEANAWAAGNPLPTLDSRRARRRTARHALVDLRDLEYLGAEPRHNHRSHPSDGCGGVHGICAGTTGRRDRPAQRMRLLSRDFDKFVGGVLAAANASPELRIEALGAFNPAPPEWANSLAELALRLGRQPALGDLPRQFDLLVHERIARWRAVPIAAAASLRLEDPAVRSDVALIAAFLRSFGSLPEDLSDLIVGGSTPKATGTRSSRETDSPPPSSEGQ